MNELIKGILKEFLEYIRDYMGYWLFIIFGLFVLPFTIKGEVRTFSFWVGIGFGASSLLCLIIAISKTKKNSKLRDKIKDSEKLIDRVKDLETNGKFYIKSESMLWEIEINPDGRISIKQVHPLCAEETNDEKCMTVIRWEYTKQCMYCDRCQKCISKTTTNGNIFWDSARRTLDEKVDKVKKELEIK